ncbi:MAG TPA: FAD-dependent monooxygenase [Thermoanaerobaculia bacterium]|nr:FAD-dependent monooxygenase [Thermoanaerobaculia bacterium]
MDTDVLIVGAGPTGLMLANQLGRRGVRTQIIDRHEGPAQQSRALGVQPRTLEIYSHLGIDREAIELGKKALGADMSARGKRAAHVPLDTIGTDLSPYPYLLILGQDDNELLMGRALRRWNLSIQWNTELVGLSQEADHVRTTVKQPDGASREISAAWVAGCDGARSSVREMNAIDFVGAPYEHVFFVADTEMTGPMVPEELNVYLWRGGFHLFFPLRGVNHWRLVGILPKALRGRDDLTLDDVTPSIRKEAGAELSVKTCRWFSTYRIHHRRAARFRTGRCFVLGDAAHIHSPVGAQGMNTGLQDAYNLAWKIALVVSGRADASLLDSYEGERLPVAQRLLATTDRMFSIIVSETTWAGLFRTYLMPRLLAMAMRIDRLRKAFFRAISQIGIRYRYSSLSVTPPGWPERSPRGGDRFPWLKVKLSAGGPTEDLFDMLNDTRFNLVTVGQASVPEIPPGLTDLLACLPIAKDPVNERELARANVPCPSFFLLRPDCYIGLCGERLEMDLVRCYFAEQMGVRG